MTIKALIDSLNNLTTGELDTLFSRVRELRAETAALGLDEIVALLDEALAKLEACDVKGFRKKTQHAVSRLGHVRESPAASGPAPRPRRAPRP